MVNDLSWKEFGDALGESLGIKVITVQMSDGLQGAKLITFTVSDYGFLKDFFENPTTGVVKALSKLLSAARIAQTKVNDGKPVGERLAAFPPSVVGTITNGQAPITQSLTSKADLSSAVVISGAIG